MNLVVTTAASDRIRRVCLPGTQLRLSLKASGCAGYSHLLEPGIEQPGDIAQDFQDFQILASGKDAVLLEGTVIDFETGLAGGKMVFRNPAESGRCGCGMSIHLKEVF